MVYRLQGLRHDAVVRRNHQDGYVRDLGAPRSHSCERLVARGVQKGDRLAVGLHLVGADVLGDPAGLLGHDVGLTDSIEKGRFTVVDVAEDRHDRGTRLQLVGVLLILRDDEGGRSALFLDRSLYLEAEHLGDLRGGLVLQDIVDRQHLPQPHQLLDHLDRVDLHERGEVVNGQRRRDLKDLGRRRSGLGRGRGLRLSLWGFLVLGGLLLFCGLACHIPDVLEGRLNGQTVDRGCQPPPIVVV